MIGDSRGNVFVMRCISSPLICFKCEQTTFPGDKMMMFVGRTSEPGVHFVEFMCAN